MRHGNIYVCTYMHIRLIATHCNTLRYTATHCNTYMHIRLIATHCNTLQHTATHCNTYMHIRLIQTAHENRGGKVAGVKKNWSDQRLTHFRIMTLRPQKKAVCFLSFCRSSEHWPTLDLLFGRISVAETSAEAAESWSTKHG